MLLIGKEPHHFLQGAVVAVTHFRGVTRADMMFSSIEFFGPIQRLFQQVMAVLESELSVITDKSDPMIVSQNHKRYSREALRELLVNALIHRDYQDRNSTKIYIFQDRIEFESPGGSIVGIEPASQGRSKWRNPSLARYVTELGLAQERGTGIPIAREGTFSVAGVAPVFESDSIFKVTVPAYRPPPQNQNPLIEAVNPESGVLLISIGHGNIDPGLVRRSREEFRNMADERIQTYHYPVLLTDDQWQEQIHKLRNWLRDCIEDPRFRELHLFYRGPVALGPLIGAIAVGRKSLIVYFYDEDSSLYRFAYRLDRRLLQEG